MQTARCCLRASRLHAMIAEMTKGVKAFRRAGRRLRCADGLCLAAFARACERRLPAGGRAWRGIETAERFLPRFFDQKHVDTGIGCVVSWCPACFKWEGTERRLGYADCGDQAPVCVGLPGGFCEFEDGSGVSRYGARREASSVVAGQAGMRMISARPRDR